MFSQKLIFVFVLFCLVSRYFFAGKNFITRDSTTRARAHTHILQIIFFLFLECRVRGYNQTNAFSFFLRANICIAYKTAKLRQMHAPSSLRIFPVIYYGHFPSSDVIPINLQVFPRGWFTFLSRNRSRYYLKAICPIGNRISLYVEKLRLSNAVSVIQANVLGLVPAGLGSLGLVPWIYFTQRCLSLLFNLLVYSCLKMK